jgi:hypothetical protein
MDRWSARRVAQVAVRQALPRLKEVGLRERDVVHRMQTAVWRADRAARSGTVQFRRTHRYRSAQNEIDKILQSEGRHHYNRDYDFFDRETDAMPLRRRMGVWRSCDIEAAAARATGTTPETFYAVREAVETMLTKAQLKIFLLHVVEGYSLTDVAWLLSCRKSDVLKEWRTIRVALR